jgi:hypothetical protein
MHDINGKALHIGDQVSTYAYGMVRITGIIDEHNEEKGGALIAVTGEGRELRTHRDKAIKIRTWKELAQVAMDVQSACNLSGVVHSFSDIIREVRARLDAEGKGGNDNLHKHPVCVLFATQIAYLTGCENGMNYSNAHNWAEEQIKGK